MAVTLLRQDIFDNAGKRLIKNFNKIFITKKIGGMSRDIKRFFDMRIRYVFVVFLHQNVYKFRSR